MKIVTVGSIGRGEVVIDVPDGCSAVINFTSTGINNQIATQNEIVAFLSADLSKAAADPESGNDNGLLALSNTNFPLIPVAPGERLLVGFPDAGSAIIYFDSI
jgi:hypothetical protein